jgi:hypothetical protein
MVADDGGGFGKYEILWSAGGVTHSAGGVGLASQAATGNTRCDFADNGFVGGSSEPWYYHSFGFYARSNAALNEVGMQAYLLTNPSNGYTYYQRIIPRFGMAALFHYLWAVKTGQPTYEDQVSVAVADSLGLIVPADKQRVDFSWFQAWGTGGATVTVNTGMGDGKGGAPVSFFGNRTIAFGFATRHNAALSVAENAALYSLCRGFRWRCKEPFDNLRTSE